MAPLRHPTTARRERAVLIALLIAMAGVISLITLLGWYLWRESVVAEEQRLGTLAERLGHQAEDALVDARSLLQDLNASPLVRCSPAHIATLQQEAIARPYIRAIGYWQAAERRCGVGFVQGAALTPPSASRIYDNGVVAWWPSPDTAVGDVELFLMRLGDHDVAIDPRLLLDAGALDDPSAGQLPGQEGGQESSQQAGLWVEGLLMVSVPANARVPAPDTLPPGLTIEGGNGRILARFSLDTVFPMDVVAVQPSRQFVQRYLPSLATASLLGLALVVLWVLVVLRVSRRRLSLTAELRSAIDSGAIDVVYQPIVDLQSGRCVGAEALARWQRAGGEHISPDVFIPLAESGRMITNLTLTLLERVAGELGGLLREQPGFTVNINLSPQDLEDARLPQSLDRVLTDAGLPANALKLEITERALVDSDTSRQLLAELRRRGHQLAVDDFGTGYSSLSYLESFELDTLKLDKAFVDAIETHAVTSSVIIHIIEMAHSLQLNMVAEGIESEHQARWLAANGVQLGQGYLYSRPLPARAFRRYLKGH
ncbi:EAL domain-containing protein [Parahaliea mediterranea]|uniref:EAL domain-containing protein n=1 Tax=Parahaliea mediterranea TaxID=651086 RepID=UPI001F4E2684|nr:EAL domain-containing protein [Parahaliea mediterranea]